MSKNIERSEDHAQPYGGETARILAMLKSRARRGDLQAVRELARLQEARSSSFQMLNIKSLDQLSAAHERLLEAALNGRLTASEAERLSRLLMAQGEALKGKVLERKLAFAEEQINEDWKKAQF